VNPLCYYKEVEGTIKEKKMKQNYVARCVKPTVVQGVSFEKGDYITPTGHSENIDNAFVMYVNGDCEVPFGFKLIPVSLRVGTVR